MTITRGMFGHEEEAISLLRAAQALELGSLKIGAIRPSDVMEIAAELRMRSPNLKLTVTLGSGPEILEGLLKFDFDVGSSRARAAGCALLQPVLQQASNSDCGKREPSACAASFNPD